MSKQQQKQDPLVAEEEGGLYAAEREMMVSLLEALVAKQGKAQLRPEMLEGDWELVRAWVGGICEDGW